MAMLLVGATPASASPGDLDPSFGSHGVVRLHGDPVHAARVAVQPDGGHVLLRVPDSGPAQLRRFANGDLDTSFAVAGVYEAPSEFRAESLDVQPNGDVSLVGSLPSPTPGARDLAEIRLTPGGSPRSSFGAGGIAQIALPNGSLRGADSMAMPDNSTVAAITQSDLKFSLARITASGDLDPGFGAGGQTDPISGEQPLVARAPDGALLLNGTASGPSGYTSLVARYDASGDPDLTYGTAGVVSLDPIPGSSGFGFKAFGFASDSAGGALVGLSVNDSGHLRRVDPQGDPDPTYDSDEALAFNQSAERRLSPSSLVVDSSDRALVTGSYFYEDASGAFARPAVARLLPDGGLDPSFSGGISDFPVQTVHTTFPRDAAIDNGRLLVGGDSSTFSLLLNPGVADADADSTGDAADACPLVPNFSADSGGCPRIKVRIKSSFSRRAGFKGTAATDFGCRKIGAGTPETQPIYIRVMRSRPGADKTVGKARLHSSSLRWHLAKRPSSGRFYAKYKTVVNPESGICGPGRSTTLRVRP